MTETEGFEVKFSIPEPARNTFWSLDIRICLGFRASIFEFFSSYISLTAFHPLCPAEDMGHGQFAKGGNERFNNFGKL